jgi:hypothetical protein
MSKEGCDCKLRIIVQQKISKITVQTTFQLSNFTPPTFSTSPNLFNNYNYPCQDSEIIATFVSRTQTICTGIKTGAKYTLTS